jgi:hypothetical protein
MTQKLRVLQSAETDILAGGANDYRLRRPCNSFCKRSAKTNVRHGNP